MEVVAIPAVLVLALIFDRLLPSPPTALHPVGWMGAYIRRFWRGRPGAERPGSSRPVLSYLYGALLVLSGTILFSLPLTLLAYLPGLWIIVPTALLLWPVFTFRGLLSSAREILSALDSGDLDEARRLTGWHLVSRPTEALREDEICGCVVESVTENLTDSFTSPLFYFLLLGLPGAWALRFINTCDALIGYRDDEHLWGGKAAARLDDVVHWIPARITGAALVLSAVLGGGDGPGALKTMVRQSRRTESPNAGVTMAAAAGAMGVSLEKRGHYILEGGAEKPSAETIRGTLRLLQGAWVILSIFFLLLTGGAALAGGQLG